MLEKQIIEKVVRYAKSIGYQDKNINSTGTGKRGFPDHLFMTPGGVTLYVEFKRLGKKPRPNQLAVIDSLLKQKCPAFVVDSVELGKQVLDKCINYRIDINN